jgi:hypothetical protein
VTLLVAASAKTGNEDRMIWELDGNIRLWSRSDLPPVPKSCAPLYILHTVKPMDSPVNYGYFATAIPEVSRDFACLDTANT